MNSSSRPTVAQPVSLLKLVFDGLALVLGKIAIYSLSLTGNLFSFWVVLIAWLLFKYLVKPVRRAFLCSDMNLYHPPPQKKVFPSWLLFVCAIVIPILIVSSFFSILRNIHLYVDLDPSL